MRRTTIFRSNQLVMLGAALAFTAGVARAQDTLQVGEQQDVHVVVEGETLWSLAERYLGDPFLWPEIYRLNTLVVEDPHWIFPGEELRLAPPDTTVVAVQPVVGEPGVAEVPQVIPGQPPPQPPPQPPEQPPQQPVQITPQFPAQPAEQPPVVEVEMPDAPLTPDAPPPPPSTEETPTVFRRTVPTTGTLASLRAAAGRYRPVRRGEFYGAGFLTEEQELPWARVLGAVGTPTLRRITATSSARIFGEIDIEAPSGAMYAVGDSLLTARLTRDIPDWGDVVVPTGIAAVTNVSGYRVRAEIIMQFGRVADAQVALPLEPFDDPGDVLPVPVANGVTGSVIEPRDRNPVAGQQDIIFIDLGRYDGVVLGDVFVVLRAPAGQPVETVAYMQIVHVRDRSASGLLTFINGLGVVPGAPVQLFRKMPS